MAEDYLMGLNKEQIEAVKTTEGYVRVLAGAGSGKTRVLTTRYAYLVDKLDIATDNILAVTFTNKAADEMKRRIVKMVGDVGTPYIMTFHGFCNRFLKSEITSLGFTDRFKIIDESDQKDIVSSLYEEVGLEYSDITYDKALSEIIMKGCKTGSRLFVSKYEELFENCSIEDLDQLMKLASSKEQKLIYGYLRAQKRDAVLDFEDLLNLTLYILENKKNVRERWQKAFSYIQVDEFQDVSMRELRLISILSYENKNLFVVGDDSQCLVTGTKVLTKKGYKNIENVRDNNVLCVATGHGEVGEFKVDKVSKRKYKGDIVKIKLKSGKEISGTPGHIGFARFEPNADIHFVYLMYRNGIGYRIGVTSGVRKYNNIIKNGFEIRLVQEHADRVWILKVVDTLHEALYYENLYSYKYGIPQYVFNESEDTALTAEEIKELHVLLDTEEKGKALLNELDYSIDYPMHVPQAGAERHKINISLFGSGKKTKSGTYSNELSINTVDEEFVETFKDILPCSVKRMTSSDNAYINGRKVLPDYDSVFEYAKKVEENCDRKGIYVDRSIRAKLTDNKFTFVPFSQMTKHMLIPIYENGKIVEDEIIDVTKEHYNGYVYDISVPVVRDFIANDIVVHNCIYSFRDANINCIVQFDKLMNKLQGRDNVVKTIYLTENYRSTPEILNASNALIKCNTVRVDKDLFTEKPSGVTILHHHAKFDSQEVNWVVDKIKSLHRPYSDYAILYRVHANARKFEEAFMNNGIPYEILSGISFYARKEIKDVLAILSLVTFSDNVSFYRIAKTMSLGLGKKKLEVLKNLGNVGSSLYDILYLNRDKAPFNNPKIKDFTNKIEALREYSEKNSISDTLNKAIIDFGFEAKYASSKEMEDIDRWNNLIELKRATRSYEMSENSGDLSDYLGMLSLYTTADVKDKENENCVKMMTIHGAKGLEFPIVFITDMNEGVLPTSRSVTKSDIEEERRVAYVAMTRAKEMLFFLETEGKNYDGSMKAPSRFLFNIPRDKYVTEGYIPKELYSITEDKMRTENAMTDYSITEMLDAIDDSKEIRVGDRVKHDVFGEGTVIKISDSAYMINFEAYGFKGIKKDSTKIAKII